MQRSVNTRHITHDGSEHDANRRQPRDERSATEGTTWANGVPACRTVTCFRSTTYAKTQADRTAGQLIGRASEATRKLPVPTQGGGRRPHWKAEAASLGHAK